MGYCSYSKYFVLSCVKLIQILTLKSNAYLVDTKRFERHEPVFFVWGRSTGDILAYVSDDWSSSLQEFGETVTVALDESQATVRVWHKALIFKLPSYGFCPSYCNFISVFLCGRSIAVVVGGYCSSFIGISGGVLQGPVLSPALFLLFISVLPRDFCPVHSYANGCTLSYSTHFNHRPTKRTESKNDALAPLILTSPSSPTVAGKILLLSLPPKLSNFNWISYLDNNPVIFNVYNRLMLRPLHIFGAYLSKDCRC